MPFSDSIKMVDVVIADKSIITATPADVVIGKTYIGGNQTYETGEMPVNDIYGTVTLLAGETHIAPYGKNENSYVVQASELDIQTPGDATENDILKNKKAWVNGEQITGAIEAVEHSDVTLLAGQEYLIPVGVHDGSEMVLAKDLASQTFGNATTDDLVKGKSAWVNGEQIAGNITDIESADIYLDAGEIYLEPRGYHSGEGRVIANDLASQTEANAEAQYIVETKTAWVNGEKIEGTMQFNPTQTIVLPLNDSYTIPRGYHSGNGKIIQDIPMHDAQTVAPTKDTQVIDVAGHYMTGNITVVGVEALNYQRLGNAIYDKDGIMVSSYDLPVENNKATIVSRLDNWHNNATFNLYHLVFTDLIDEDGNSTLLDCQIAIDFADNAEPHTYIFGNITITIELDDSDAHTFVIDHITSGKISIIDVFDSRELGN